MWRADLEQALQLRVGSTRRLAWGDPVVDSNVYENIIRELAVLYDSPPTVRHDVGDAAIAGLVAAIRLSGVWALMARVQSYTLGLREALVRVDVAADGRPRYRPVYPDMVLALGTPDRPDRPVRVHELRVRLYEGREAWTLDCLDVTDPDTPAYQVRACREGVQPGDDLSGLYLRGEGMTGGWPDAYRRDDGRPILPYVLYHAQRTGDRLWDPYRWIELVDASLNLAVKSNLFEHAYLQASHPQRWIANLRPVGAEIADGQRDGVRSEIVVDPSTILVLETDGESSAQPMVGQWQPGADVAMMEEVLGNIAARLATQAGVPASDLQRLGGTARSGVAISLTNEGKRSAQRRFSEQFRDSDERLIAVTAAMVNRVTGSRYPEGGYSIVYRELPLSPEEMAARREHVLALLAQGLISPVRAYQELNPGTSEEQARQDLAGIAAARMITGLRA